MSYMTKAPGVLPAPFTSWSEYLDYLVSGPLKGYWYRWNVNYRISLRVVLSEVRSRIDS